jgi:NAD(P)-dependent dehydrogenase (short-subunit alcohol dehydrogenase family)
MLLIMRLQNKVIIVTGSTTGIGKAIALRCAEEGARIVIHGLEQDRGEAVVTEIGTVKQCCTLKTLVKREHLKG